MSRAFRSLPAWALLLVLGACSRSAKAPVQAAAAAPEAAAAPAEEKPLPYELRLGQATYNHYCVYCHGDTGAGDGFNAFNVDPHPRDFSDPAWQKSRSDADLVDAIRRGGAGVGLSPMMPPWGRTLSAAQIDQVVQYIRTLKKTAP